MHVGRPAARILELRERGNERELAAYTTVHVPERSEPQACARAVELSPPALQAPGHGALGAAPQCAAKAVARHARAERVDREMRFTVRVHMGHEGRARDLLLLRRQ